MRRVIFHSFLMGDVDDPELYASPALYEWQQTEPGQWVMDHCKDPRYNIGPDGSSWGHRVSIYGEVEDKDAMYWQLKWGK